MYAATATRLQAQFEEVRASLTHSAARGGAAEEIFRKFLIEALPPSLGVAVGQVVDSHGNFSGQSDVIVYDAQATPMLFTSAQGGTQTVPIEGVIAVIEVKSRLQRKDLGQLVAHAQKVKSMEPRAFLPQSLTIHRTLYDQEWANLPVLYSVFAFTSDGLYVGELNSMLAEVPLHRRVDNLCALDRGLVVNVCLTEFTPDERQLQPQFTFQATATRISKLAEVTSDNPLMPWFAMNSSLYVRASRPPLNLAVYVQDQLMLGATMPMADTAEFQTALYQHFADALGISVELAHKVGRTITTPTDSSGQPTSPPPDFSFDEILALVDPYSRGLFIPGPEGMELFGSLAAVPVEQRPAVLVAFAKAPRPTSPAPLPPAPDPGDPPNIAGLRAETAVSRG